MMRRMCCQRSSIVTARSSAFVDQAAEARHMDYGALTLVVVVGVEPQVVERLPARCAAIPILAPAADPDHLAAELRARIEALSLPEPALAALDQPLRHATRLPTGERLKVVRCRLPPALRQIAHHEVG